MYLIQFTTAVLNIFCSSTFNVCLMLIINLILLLSNFDFFPNVGYSTSLWPDRDISFISYKTGAAHHQIPADAKGFALLCSGVRQRRDKGSLAELN